MVLTWVDPLLLSCAETDGAFPSELRRKAVDVLQMEKKVYHLQLFQGVSHGFASRGDLDDPYESECHVTMGMQVALAADCLFVLNRVVQGAEPQWHCELV
jgi:dienelactone hydrolase